MVQMALKQEGPEQGLEKTVALQFKRCWAMGEEGLRG